MLQLYSGLLEVKEGMFKKQLEPIAFCCMANNPDEALSKVSSWPVFQNKTINFKIVVQGVYKNVQRPPGQYHKGVWWRVPPNQP